MIKSLLSAFMALFFLTVLPAAAEDELDMQRIDIIVVDGQHNPLPGIKPELTPLAGGLHGELKPSDSRGHIILQWIPQIKQDEQQSEDYLLRYLTAFTWQVETEGYLPNSGTVEKQNLERHVGTEELLSLDTLPAFPPMRETIILHKRADLSGFGLDGDKARLRQWCQRFYEQNYKLASALGTPFSWPAFTWQNGTLTISLQYMDSGWSGAADASLLHRAALNTYLPWCLLLRENIAGLPDTQSIRLTYVSNMNNNPLDPHAWSQDLKLEALIPLAALANLKLAGNLAQLAARFPLRQVP